jgi:hypothetical protein
LVTPVLVRPDNCLALSFPDIFVPESSDERAMFLTRFYSDAKASFAVFDQHICRSQVAVERGYAILLREVYDDGAQNEPLCEFILNSQFRRHLIC